MKNLTFISFFFLFFSVSAISQDMIYLNDGSEIKAYINLEREDFIYYKKTNKQKALTQQIAVEKIKSIRYQDGTIKNFNTNDPQPEDSPDPANSSGGNKPKKDIPDLPGQGNNNNNEGDGSSFDPDDKMKGGQNGGQSGGDTGGKTGSSSGGQTGGQNSGIDIGSLLPLLSLIDFGKLDFGLSAGLNVSANRHDFDPGPNPPSGNFRPGYFVGLFLELPFSDSYGLQSWVAYQNRGSFINMESWALSSTIPSDGWSTQYNGDISTSINYLDISLLLVKKFDEIGKMSLELGVGGYLGFGLSGSEVQDYSIQYYNNSSLDQEDIFNKTRTTEFTDGVVLSSDSSKFYYKSMDYGLAFYTGFLFPKFKVGPYLNYGLTELENRHSMQIHSGNFQEFHSKAITFGLSFTYLLN